MKSLSQRTRNAKSDDGKGTFFVRGSFVSGQDLPSARTFSASVRKRELTSRRSRGFTLVVLQNTAESMFAFNLAGIEGNNVATTLVEWPSSALALSLLLTRLQKSSNAPLKRALG
jgi:hypothetical protein